MDIAKEWARRPPTEPMTSLAALVRDFQTRFPRDRRDMVWEFCRNARSLPQALQRATMSLNEQGIMHNHQSRVPRAIKEAYLANLTDRYTKQLRRVINSSASQRFGVASPGYDSFDALHDICEDAVVPGVGPVFVYDVATRIGAWCNIAPTSLYLHAGVAEGYAALCAAVQGGTVADAQKNLRKLLRVPKELLLPGLCPPLTADEAEDFLCTYRSVFGRVVPRG